MPPQRSHPRRGFLPNAHARLPLLISTRDSEPWRHRTGRTGYSCWVWHQTEQIETTMFGPMNVTRAALPVLRAQRSGLVVTISSTAGLAGGEFLSAYAASKFGVEGWAESLALEVAPFGIRSMIVEPGFFRAELLTPESTSYAESTIGDYAERTAQTVTAWKGMNGLQGGDPAKLAEALIQLAELDEPPLRFAAGADAVGVFETRGKALQLQADAHRELSRNLALSDA
ncbi:SDR family NAD(P)-dependent oxidoreductase [Pseudarthrobacter sp. MDT3-1]